MLEADNKKKRSFWAVKPFLKCSLIPDDDNFDSLTPYQRSILFDNKDEQDKSDEKDKEPQQATESQGFSVEDLFHFWLLTGGDIESELLSPVSNCSDLRPFDTCHFQDPVANTIIV